MTDSIPRILIAEPIYLGMVPKVYANRIKFWSKCENHRRLGGYRFNSLVLGPRENIRAARKKAIQTAIKQAATHILFIDDDVLIPENIIPELLAVDKDIIGGLMYKDDDTPLVWRDQDAPEGKGVQDGDVGRGEMPWLNYPGIAPFECAAVAAGCMLVKTSVFSEMLVRFGLTTGFCFNYDDSPRSMDVRFCRMARMMGKQVWCLPEPACVQVKHY